MFKTNGNMHSKIFFTCSSNKHFDDSAKMPIIYQSEVSSPEMSPTRGFQLVRP